MTTQSTTSSYIAGERQTVWHAAHPWQTQCVLAVAASLFVAVCAHVAVPLPLTPVPFTLQPFAVVLVGMVFGPTLGFAALATYLVEGAIGLPVFTPVGAPGIARLLGPTGGYLLSYPVAAALAGLARVLQRRFSTFLLFGASSMLLVYLCGSAWFSHLLGVPFRSALEGTVFPFALPDAIKVFVAAGMASSLHRITQHATAASRGSRRSL